MKVPEEANGGNARITFSFPDWRRGPVTPKTIEVALRPAVATPAAALAVSEERTSDLLSGDWLLYAGMVAGAVLLIALVTLFRRRC